MKSWRYLLIGSVIGLTVTLLIFLRFYQLGSIPGGIALDEANYGYDAYSISDTGKDMWGQMGISLKSLGEYKPAGLTFTLIPIIKVFGLSTFTTRLPSAVFGLLTLIVTFYLLKLLLKDSVVSFIGAIFLGLSPWHFGLSRQYYESVSGLFFIVASIYFQIKYIRDPKVTKNIIIAAVLASFGGYYYQVLRYLGLGQLGLVVAIPNWGKLKLLVKYGFIALLFWTFASIPYLGDMFGSRGLMRLSQENSMHEFGDVLTITENRQLCYLSSGKNLMVAKICYAWWNKPGEQMMKIGKTYIELLSPKYLFNENNQSDTIIPFTGAYLEFMVIFYVLGLYYLVKNIGKKEHLYLLLSYLFSAIPIAVSFSLGIQRNVVGLYLVLIISSYGLYFGKVLLFRYFKWPTKAFAIIGISLIFIWLQSRYLANYFLVYTKTQPEVWHTETPEIMRWLGENNKGRKIVFLDFPYATLYYSFFNKLDPVEFQSSSKWSEPDKFGALNIVGVSDKIISSSGLFEEICIHKNKAEPSKLLVLPGHKPDWSSVVLKQTTNFTGIHVLHEIYDTKSLYDLGVCGFEKTK